MLDVLKPKPLAETTDMAAGAIRVSLGSPCQGPGGLTSRESNRRLLHLTERSLKRQSGAETFGSMDFGRGH
jgi:hypothetical protein